MILISYVYDYSVISIKLNENDLKKHDLCIFFNFRLYLPSQYYFLAFQVLLDIHGFTT